MNMKSIKIASILLLSFCSVSFAQNQNNLTDEQMNDALRKDQKMINKFSKMIEKQEKTILRNNNEISKLKEERDKYSPEVIKAFDKKKVMEIDNYLKTPLSKMDRWYLEYILEKAQSYPNDRDMKEKALQISKKLNSKKLFDKAVNLNEQLKTLQYHEGTSVADIFNYDGITHLLGSLQNSFKESQDEQLREAAMPLFSYLSGINYLNDVVIAVQKLRKKNAKAQWEKDFKPLFDKLNEKAPNNDLTKKGYIESLPYLRQCLEALQNDLQLDPSKKSFAEDEISLIMGRK